MSAVPPARAKRTRKGKVNIVRVTDIVYLFCFRVVRKLLATPTLTGT